MYYVRNLKEDKWRDKEKWSMYSFEDLHTAECKLSVWAISHKEEEDILEVALAIAMTKDWLCNVWLCLVPTQRLKCNKIRIKRSKGDTKYTKMANKHVDLILPQIQDMQRLYEYLHKYWMLGDGNEYLRCISKTKLEEKFFSKINNGELDDFIQTTIRKKEEKAYKKYYKKIKSNQHAKDIEASMNGQ